MRSQSLAFGRARPRAEFTRRRYEPGFRQAPHSHDYDGITLVVRGRLEEFVGAHVVSASALSVVFKPCGVGHALAVGEDGASTLRITLGPGTLAAALPGLVRSDRVSVLPAGWKWTHAGPAAAAMLYPTAASGAPWRARSPNAASSARTAVRCLLQVFSEMNRDRAGEPVRSEESAPVWLEQVRESIDAPASGLRLAAAARAARVHPVYLARMFRRHYGCSVGEMAKRGRLRLAARLLGEFDLSLADVAGEAGFSDQAHLCREFRHGTGVTPLQYRSVAAEA